MSDQEFHSSQADTLRQRAEKVYRLNAAQSSENLEAELPEETRQILHELRVHQIQLEMQNEELRRVQLELEITRKKYFDLYDLAPVGYVILDETGIILEANLTAAVMLGAERSQLVNKSITRFVLREDQDLYYLCHKQLLETHERQGCEMRMVRMDGLSIWAQIDISAVQGIGEMMRTWVVLVDITARKQAEEALQESQAYAQQQSVKLKAVIDAMPAGVLIAHDPECSQITCNPMWLEIVGVINEQNPDNEASCEQPRLEIRRDGETISMDQLPVRVACVSGSPVIGDNIEVIRADGVTRHFYGNAVPLFDSQGAVRGAVGVLLDITELKQAQDKVAGLAAIVESSSDAIIGKTLDGIIVSWNHGAEALYGYSDKEALGRSITFLIPPDHPDEIPPTLEKIRRAETITDNDNVHMRKDGGLVSVSLTVAPVKDSEGRIVGSSTIARDITDRKKFEERIRQYSRELEQSNRELDNFALIVAHDLRAPLRAVSGFAARLQKRYKEKLDAEADQYIAFISEGTERMERLITDLLEYARVGNIGKPPVPVDVKALMEKVLTDLKPEITERQAVITVESLPVVSADGTQLMQVLENLVGNALKYCTNEPRIRISAERKDGEWLFRVSDNGIGIDPRQFARIFDIFQRLHTREAYSGSGVGLAICKKIVERFGGRIWVESKPGEGSTFLFTLPVTDRQLPADGKA